ncbi:MAG: acyl-homoserine-lactone acylase [Halieaceae bacterium]|jgi:acyl-homoserine-lactone acylase
MKKETRKIVQVLSLAAGVCALLVSCSHTETHLSDAPDSMDGAMKTYAFDATLHRTEGGIPHIIARDWGSLGYGQAYAASQDHFCELARNILKYRSQLSEYFGAGDGNLQSDLFFKLQTDVGLYDHTIDQEFAVMFAGYAAGFNRYVRDHEFNKMTDPQCANADWIPRMTAQDVRRIHLMPAFLPALSGLIVAAQPPTEETGGQVFKSSREASQKLAELGESLIKDSDKGSNGVAIGRDLSSDGAGLLYTNPHLNWRDFDFRMYGTHHIIPGVINLLGANQAQRANVGFGTNGNIAWTNTVSTAMDFTFYQLELVPDNVMAYMFDGEQRDIETIPVTVNVLMDDGDISEHRHNFYRTHLGWMVGGAFAWQDPVAFSLRIADEGARGFQGGALAFSRARTVRELKAASNRYQSTAGVNTIAADSSGEVLYGDLGPVVNLTDQQLQDCRVHGQVFLGNTSACEWNNDADAAAAGLLGASKQPFLFRTDYVTNSNDSFWLTNPETPLTGFPKVHGDTDTERRMRTRSGLAMVQARQKGLDGLSGNTFDLETLQERLLSNQNMAGQLLRDDLVTLCNNNPQVKLDSGEVDISAACPILANWDLTVNLDSRGAHLFREFIRAVRTKADGRGSLPAALRLRKIFDSNNPLTTPTGLDSKNNPVALTGLASAVRLLTDAGIALDARLGDIQGVTRNGDWIPLHGGDDMEGIFNKMSLEFDGENGYPEVTGSSGSWIMVTRVAGNDTRVQGLTTYSQSTDSTSENYANLTRRFSNKQLVDIPFLQKDVEAAALSTIRLVEGTGQCVNFGWKVYALPNFADEAECNRYFRTISERQLTDFVAQ